MGVKRDIDDLQNEIAKVQRDLSDLIDKQNRWGRLPQKIHRHFPIQ